MSTQTSIKAEQVRDWSAQARYVMMAARCLEQGAPTNELERMECMLYMMELAEELSKRAEEAADALARTLFMGSEHPTKRGEADSGETLDHQNAQG